MIPAYLKYLFQLILSPSRGWEDISHDGANPEELLQRGFYPLTGIAAATEFLKLLYGHKYTLGAVLQQAIATFCTYFAAVYLSKLILEALIPKVTEGEPSERRTDTLNVMCMGLMVIIAIIANCVPAELTPVKFLPIYVLLIYYKASRYMAVRADSEMSFIGTGIAAVVLVPVVLHWLLSLILG